MRKAPRKLLNVGVAAAFALSLVMAARTPLSAHSAHASMPTLNMDYFVGSNGQLAGSLDPAQITSASDADTIMLTNSGLITVGTNNKIIPQIAKKWTISKDHRTYTFFLRHAVFANGHTVTAQDFVYSIRRALAPAANSPVAYYDAAIKGYDAYNSGKSNNLGIKAINSTTLQIQTAKPAAYFLFALTYPVNDALDPSVVRGKEAGPNNNFLTTNCPGNQGAGQFKFVCSGSAFYPSGRTASYTLVPNPKYWGHKAKIKLFIPAVNTLTTGYNEYLSGQIDMSGIPTANLDQWRSNHRGQFFQAPSSTIGYISLNTKAPPFNDVNCRLAAAWGIDRNAVVAILHHAPKALYTIVPKGFLGWWNGSGVPHFNLAKAKSYFNKCATRDTAFTYKYNTGSTDGDNLANGIVNMLNNVGFHAKVEGITVHDWIQVVSNPLSKTGTIAVRNGWQQDYPDPQDYVSLLFRCGNQYDIGEWCNSKFDSLVDKADSTFNSKTRASLYMQAQKIALNNGVPVVYDNGVFHALIKPYVHGLVLTVAYADIVAKNLDWSNVTISKH